MSQSTASSVVDFLSIVERLKRTKRTGWVNSGISGPESIADHMYRMGIMAMLIDDSSLDRTRCIKMAIVHDLAEALVGDITPFDGVSKADKFKLEKQGMHDIVTTLGNSRAAREIEALWLEYEEDQTNEAHLVHDLDKCEMIQQAMEYEISDSIKLDSFFNTTKGIFRHPQVQAWVEEIYRRRRAATD
ncbi:hypothetical protein IWW55_004243 [Coemansia sp. RSA 2706]|nr:hypothetical protein LPJ70_004343 [Coemansia sp. RSA 2708]KAJ2299237.1 hypothetical protein IWW55_004243 [Coemansia sp. RSA 2706]KAJ2306069.1 hypothetical protein IWW54_004868 [Coemansia sp. RSA 2705]KAJ2319074.1 hypothetical protein IWW52_002179 [Coemansia sp. RSA 2704]KAJ2323482.1 hypothetical protein IWW51_003735 [Coemansia sp. RSA 2702]KAJ2721302.1 hypothetical protein H4R23_004607 [Coemansia sp. Cherry 401B]